MSANPREVSQKRHFSTAGKRPFPSPTTLPIVTTYDRLIIVGVRCTAQPVGFFSAPAREGPPPPPPPRVSASRRELPPDPPKV
ncbi:hypothetical protein LX32DRAFT_640889, partial [Colletotrichum zoysiae]